MSMHTAEEKGNGRLEAFSDGVFAIAITLLVLDLHVPSNSDVHSAGELLSFLGKQWPSYIAYISSFATILLMWINHHGIFRMVRQADKTFMLANGFLLLLITAVPFPTQLLAEYLASNSTSTSGTSTAAIACAIYSGYFVLINIGYAWLWLSAARNRRLLKPYVSDTAAREVTRNMLVGLPLYALATALAFVNPYLSFGIVSALWIFWAFAVRIG